MKNYTILSGSIVVACLLTIAGCKNLIEIDLPKDQLTTEKVFADSANTVAAILGIYHGISGGFSSGAVTTYQGLSADELHPSSTTAVIQEFFQNNLTATNGNLGANWSNVYQSIYKTNAIIEGVEKSETMLASQKAAFMGEARTMRAYFYFNLVNLYGPVPLVLSTDYNFTRTQPRNLEEEIYDQIVEDLNYAISVLPQEVDGNIRVNRDVAMALLARVCLFDGEYEMAKRNSTELINSNRYTLAASPNDVFSPQSTETIWSLMSVNPARATQEGFTFIPSSSTARPAYVISNTVLDAFETDDLRKSQWIRTNTVNGQPYSYPYKYKMRTSDGSTDLERYVVLRLAEQYLIRAEAETKLKNYAAAIVDVNRIRQRANLEDFPSTDDPSAILREIEKQRQLELMCEWGHRWFDLKRTGRIDDILQQVKPQWNANDVLYPIPQTQLDRNPFLVQNTGY